MKLGKNFLVEVGRNSLDFLNTGLPNLSSSCFIRRKFREQLLQDLDVGFYSVMLGVTIRTKNQISDSCERCSRPCFV